MSGPIPRPYTQAHRWLLEAGVSAAEFARRAGVHVVLARAHLSGRQAISRRISEEYRAAFPGGPWQWGRLRRYKRPLPIRCGPYVTNPK